MIQLERSLVLVKPDGVQRKLIGRIITRFEEAMLDIVAIKMLTASRDLVDKHYQKPADWLTKVGGATINDYKKLGLDPKKELGTEDPLAAGEAVRKSLVDFIIAGPIVAMVVEGPSAVKHVRRIVGATFPISADPGSIRGMFSADTADRAAVEHRPVLNLVHASGELDEALAEVELWFPELAQ